VVPSEDFRGSGAAVSDPNEDLAYQMGFVPDDDDDFDYEEEWEFDCHMDRNGICGMAGSEDCDFECPNRNVKKN
jgi:hypothetical protein